MGNSLFESIIKLKVVFRDGDGREGHSCSTCPEAQEIVSQLRLELSATDSCPGAGSCGTVGSCRACPHHHHWSTPAAAQLLLGSSCVLLGVACAARQGRHDSPIEGGQSVVFGGSTAAR